MSAPRLETRPVDLDADAALLHAWVTHPRSVFWGMAGATRDDVVAAYAEIDADPHHEALIGLADGEPQFLLERYDPHVGPLAGLPELRPGDVGMHLLVAPTDTPRRGFTRAVMAHAVRACLARPGDLRVVVEPDVRNEAIAVLNAAAGFTVAREITLPDKTAALSFCRRADFFASPLGHPGKDTHPMTLPTADHLRPAHLQRAQAHLVAKAIAELSHERLLAPEEGPDGYLLRSPDGRAEYRFRARRLALEHWSVDEESLERTVAGEPAPLDVQQLVIEFAPVLGLPDDLLATYLEELAGTLAAACWKLEHPGPSAKELLDADYQEIEAAMTEGHPGFLANNGRIGFGVADHAAYAPECGTEVHLLWLGVRREVARLSLGEGLDEQRLYDGELDAETRERFDGVLAGLGLDPRDYLLLPVHPWQWQHKIAVTFAPDLARRDLVLLGEGPDGYRAQQSIRTFFNTDRPERHYVKTALSIQNMGFLRGLSAAYMEATPAINDWVADVVGADLTLRRCGFSVLRERAAIGYVGGPYEQAGTRSAQRKMLAALWRESPMPRLAHGERLATLASLLHRDPDGRALVSALVAASPVGPVPWVQALLRAYLLPFVHCLLRHDLCFMPHGENLVLVLRDHLPVRTFLKDVGEEVAVMGDAPLPPEIERIRVPVPLELQALTIHTDIFDGVLRHLAAILDEDGVLAEEEFWREVAACIRDHEEQHPELAEAARRHDLLRGEFAHSCLNRLQLRNTREMVDLQSPAESLQLVGTLDNPAAAYAREVERVG